MRETLRIVAMVSVLLSFLNAHADGLPTDLSGAWQTDGSFELSPATPYISAERLQELNARITEILEDDRIRGHSLSAQIIDAQSGESLFERNATTALKPASNTKLFTTAAALHVLGPDAEPSTSIYRVGELDGGTVHGDLLMFGDHDMTWSTEFYPDENFVIEQLVDGIEDAGITDIRGDILVRGLFVVNGHRFSTFNRYGHALRAAELLRRELLERGIRVYGEFQIEDSFEIPGNTTLVSEWSAVPLRVITAYINRLSHNEYADALLRWIGHHSFGESSYESGFIALRAWAEQSDITTDGLMLYDGSGLSHDNRMSARSLVELHQLMRTGAYARIWRSSLSAAGVNGTYARRMSGDDTRGRTFCKSGTIDGVITGSGIIRNRYDNRDYIFALMMNDLRNQPAARRVQDVIVSELATNLRGLSPLQVPPTLRSVVSEEDEVRISYSPSPGADRCDVWVREPGDEIWSWVAGEALEGEADLTVRPPNPSLVAYRVTCSRDNSESISSDVYLASTGGMSQPRRVLLVDGNDRWTEEPAEENELEGNHDFLLSYSGALIGDRVSSVHHSELPDVSTSLADYDLVVWAWGEQGAEWRACGTSTQAWMEEFVAMGGALFASGSEAAWQLCNSEVSSRTFLNTVFAADFVSDDAGTRVATASFNDVDETLYFLDPHGMFVGYPDTLRVLSNAQSCADYLGASDTSACVMQTGEGGSTAFVGFPVESIVSDQARDSWLSWMFAELVAPN